MTRKIISALLALILCFSLVVTVSAEAKAVDVVIDELGYLTDGELGSLNELADSIYEETGVGIFFVYAQTDSVEDYDVTAIAGGITDYVIMLENETHWYMHLGGRGGIIDLDAEAALREIYDETATYVEGVMAFLEAAAEYFPAVTTSAESEENIAQAEEYFVYDEADLLTDSEEAALEQKLADISHTYDAQLVVCTMESLDGADIDDFVHYLYDTMGFGYGENKDGAVLLVCMDVRQYRILSNGYAGVAIGPDQIDTLCDFMDTYLPGGHYTTAFDAFAEQCEKFLDGHLNGYPFNVGKNLLISLVIGLAAGLIVAVVLKGQLKSVRKQYQANVYVKQGSMQVNVRHDIFLYRNVTRTRREKESSSSSSGSGGTARSVGGGSF